AFVKHLGVLERAGLITSAKSGRVRTCHLAPERIAELTDWVAERRAVWEARLDALETHLTPPTQDTP
ncbi:MAG: transcriptional regulator, partial [Pseudomonadota bacterium]